MSEPDPSILRYYLGIVWRWKWLPIGAVVVLGALALGSSLRQGQVWSTSAGVLLNHQDQVAASVSGVQTPPEDAGRYAVTQTLVAQSPVLAHRVLAAIGRPSESPQWLYNHTSVASNADVLNFFVHGSTAELVTRLANVYAEQYTTYRRELDTQDLESTLASLGSRLSALAAAGQQRSSLYAQLSAKQEQVRLIEALRRSNVYVIRTATSDEATQVAPRPMKNLALGMAGGLVLGLLLVAIANAFDRRVHDVRELEEALGAPLLARTAASHESDAAASEEAVRLAALLAHAARSADVRSLLVASATGDEETGLVGSLAEALAGIRGDVVLVDADFTHRSLTTRYDLARRPGLADAAAGDGGGLAELAGEAAVPTGRLRVVPAGTSPALAASDAVVEALRRLTGQADFSLVGAAPLAGAPEAPVLASAVDGVVLLVASEIDRRTLGEVRRILDVASSRTLGFVLLGSSPRRRRRAAATGSGVEKAVTIERRPMVGEA